MFAYYLLYSLGLLSIFAAIGVYIKLFKPTALILAALALAGAVYTYLQIKAFRG